MAVPALARLPGRHLALAAGAGLARGLCEEWRASSPYRWLTSGPRPSGFGMQPRDFRPADPEAGRRILAGAFRLAGAEMAVGPRGDPWDRPSPSRAFAAALHSFGWLPDVLAAGGDGAAEALRLTLEWRRVFGRWNGFSWAPEIMARRVFNLACAGVAVAARASEAETALIASDLARQARVLLDVRGAEGAAERAAAAAVAGAALSGRAGERLRRRALAALGRALPVTVEPDGGHASRRADAALELLFDLQTLDDALIQRGVAGPETVQRAIDRLASTVRFFTLADGGLAAFHGGSACSASYVAAARAQDELGDRPTPGDRNGYHRLDGRSLQLMADAAPPPQGAWSRSACAPPLGVELLAGGRRLIGAAAWRGIEGGSTLAMGGRPFGRVLSGFAGRALGPWLVDADARVDVSRHEAPGALWLDLSHEGWMRRYGVRHQRRLYLDVEAAELRGEDRLTPTARAQGPDGRHFVPFVLRFHLAPGVSALASQDRRSVLLRAEGESAGWRLLNDTLDIEIEPSLRIHDGQARPAQQLVLRGQRRADSGARVRWKLSPAAARVDGAAPAA